ncbi:MAG: hypothetical protein MJZ65_03585 [Paludibacteraceae bacterium]|nr:hypothetical protein [Paludibacteraceae bacterium]
MNKHLLIIAILLLTLPLRANDQITIDKENCTITKDGKTFPLYGKVKIVESFPDLEVKLVESFSDLDVKLVESFPDQCGEIQIVESFPDIKVKLVSSFPDLKVKIVGAFQGIKQK